jgi:hypothetical protein
MQTEEISKVVAVISRGGVFWVFFFFLAGQIFHMRHKSRIPGIKCLIQNAT